MEHGSGVGANEVHPAEPVTLLIDVEETTIVPVPVSVPMTVPVLELMPVPVPVPVVTQSPAAWISLRNVAHAASWSIATMGAHCELCAGGSVAQQSAREVHADPPSSVPVPVSVPPVETVTPVTPVVPRVNVPLVPPVTTVVPVVPAVLVALPDPVPPATWPPHAASAAIESPTSTIRPERPAIDMLQP